MPIQRRLPKIGFRNPTHLEFSTVNVGDLGAFEANSVVDVDTLRQKNAFYAKAKKAAESISGAARKAWIFSANDV